MHKFIAGLNHTYTNIKHGLGILLGLVYVVYHTVFLKVNVVGTGQRVGIKVRTKITTTTY